MTMPPYITDYPARERARSAYLLFIDLSDRAKPKGRKLSGLLPTEPKETQRQIKNRILNSI